MLFLSHALPSGHRMLIGACNPTPFPIHAFRRLPWLRRDQGCHHLFLAANCDRLRRRRCSRLGLDFDHFSLIFPAPGTRLCRAVPFSVRILIACRLAPEPQCCCARPFTALVRYPGQRGQPGPCGYRSRCHFVDARAGLPGTAT